MDLFWSRGLEARDACGVGLCGRVSGCEGLGVGGGGVGAVGGAWFGSICPYLPKAQTKPYRETPHQMSRAYIQNQSKENQALVFQAVTLKAPDSKLAVLSLQTRPPNYCLLLPVEGRVEVSTKVPRKRNT